MTEQQRIIINRWDIPIERNEDGIAIINAYNKKNEVVGTAFVDDCLWHDLFQKKWRLTDNYFTTFHNGTNILMHRYIMKAKKFDPYIEHINGQIHDNRLQNLKFTNIKKPRQKTSMYKGVHWNTKQNKWVVSLKKNKQLYHLGSFDDEHVAAIHYNLKSNEVYKKPSKLNRVENEKEIIKQIIPKFKYCEPNKIPKKEKSSIYRGVSFNRNAKKYVAAITLNKQKYYLGLFESDHDAARAYNAKLIEIHGKDCKFLNKIKT